MKVGQRGEKDIVESVAAHQCLTFMIKECKQLFKVPFELMNGLSQHEDCLINDFGLNPRAHPIELRHYIDHKLRPVFSLLIGWPIIWAIRENLESLQRNWLKFDVIQNVTIHWQKTDDNSPLKYWKGKVDVPNTKPRYLLEFILHKRRLWDIDLIELKELAEVFKLDRFCRRILATFLMLVTKII